MKRALLLLLPLLPIACGGASGNDAARARAYANVVACAGDGKKCERIEGLKELADGLWRFRYADDNLCVTIALDDFEMHDSGRRIEGASASRCD